MLATVSKGPEEASASFALMQMLQAIKCATLVGVERGRMPGLQEGVKAGDG